MENIILKNEMRKARLSPTKSQAAGQNVNLKVQNKHRKKQFDIIKENNRGSEL